MAPKRAPSESDAVPRAIHQDEIEELTDRIHMLDVSESTPRSEEDLGDVLASFEGQLLELNKALRESTDGKIGTLHQECQLTRRAVVGLNSELDVVIKGDS
jgi:hypothetical protein